MCGKVCDARKHICANAVDNYVVEQSYAYVEEFMCG